MKINKKVFSFSLIPLAVLSTALGVSLSYKSFQNSTEISQLNPQTTLLRREYHPEISQTDFITRANRLIENSKSQTNQITQLDWLLNPQIKLNIKNNMSITKDGNAKNEIKHWITNNEDSPGAHHLVRGIDIINSTYKKAKAMPHFEKIYNISDANFSTDLKKDLDEKTLFVPRNGMTSRYNIESKQTIYQIDDMNTLDWTGRVLWNSWNKHNNLNAKYVSWNVNEIIWDTNKRVDNQTHQKQNDDLYFKENTLNVISKNSNYINPTKISFDSNNSIQFFQINKRQAWNIEWMLRFGVPMRILYKAFNRDVDGEKYFGHRIWKDSWIPKRGSDLVSKSGDHFTEYERNLMFNALILADYHQHIGEKSAHHDTVKRVFNNDSKFESWRNEIIKDIKSSVETGSVSKSDSKSTRDSTIRDKTYDIIINLEKNWPGPILESNSKLWKPFTSLNTTDKNDIQGNWVVDINVETKLINPIKPNVNLLAQNIKSLSIDKLNISKLFLLKKSTDSPNQSRIEFGFNNDLLLAFHNQAYLVNFYKQMQKYLVRESEFQRNSTIKELFLNSYSKYAKLFNRFLISGLLGKYNLSEMKSIEKLFYHIKNNSSNLSQDTISRIEGNLESLMDVEIRSTESLKMPSAILPSSYKSQWLKTLQEAGFEFKTPASAKAWNLQSNNIYFENSFDSLVFNDGTKAGVTDIKNDYNLYYNFIMPLIMSQDLYAETKNLNQNGWTKQKIYDGKAKTFTQINAPVTINPDNKLPNSNSQLMIRNIYLDNTNKKMGQLYEANRYLDSGEPNQKLLIETSSILQSTVENMQNYYEKFTSENLADQQQIKEINRVIYWSPQSIKNARLFTVNKTKLVSKSSNHTLEDYQNTQNLLYLPETAQISHQQLKATQYDAYSKSNATKWREQILNTLIYYFGINKNLYEDIDKLIPTESNNQVITKDLLKTILKEEYHSFINSSSLQSIAKSNYFKTFAIGSWEANLAKYLVDSHLDLNKLLPNDKTGKFFILIDIAPAINTQTLKTTDGFYLISKNNNPTGTINSYKYMLALNTHNIETSVDSEKVDKYNALAKEKVFLSEKEIPMFINKLKAKENLFLDFIKIGNRKIDATIGGTVTLENIQYLEVLYSKTIHSLANNGIAIPFNLQEVKGLELLDATWKINNYENKILIPLSEFIEKKVVISLPTLNNQESEDYFWIGWSPELGETKTLDDLITNLNTMDLNSKKILFNFSEDHGDYIDEINFSKFGNKIKVVFTKGANAEFIKDNSLIINSLKNFVGVENLELKDQFMAQLKNPTLEKIEKFSKQFEQYSLSKKYSFFNSKTTNGSNPLGALAAIEMITTHNQEDKTTSILFNISLKDGFVWKDGVENEIAIEVNFDDAIESNVSVSKTKSLIQPKVDIIKIQQFIDQNDIYSLAELEQQISEIAPEDKIEFLNWKIDASKNEAVKNIEIDLVENNIQIQVSLKTGFKWSNSEFDGLLKTTKFKLKTKTKPETKVIKSDNIQSETDTSAAFNEAQVVPIEKTQNSNSTLAIIISVISILAVAIIAIGAWLLYKFKFKKRR